MVGRLGPPNFEVVRQTAVNSYAQGSSMLLECWGPLGFCYQLLNSTALQPSGPFAELLHQILCSLW